MAKQYTNVYSNFPNAVMEATEVKDIDADVLENINTFNEALESGDYELAQSLYNANSLGDYAITAYMWNKIFEEVRNMQIYAKTKGQQIFYVDSIDDIPSTPVDGDIYRVKNS